AIDDIQVNLDLIRATFSDDEDINMLFANSAAEGIELLNNNKIDVILLDISMPEMDGLEALKIMRMEHKTLPIIIVTANHEKKNEALELGASDFIYKPYDISELRLRTINYAKLKQYGDQINNQKEILEIQVLKRTHELHKALELAQATEKEIAARLGRAAEYRDIETGGHIRRMTHYSALLAELHSMNEDEVELVLHAAPLHDVGKVGIPDSILLKPGRFEPHEFEIMKTHSSIGAKILEKAEQFPTIEAGKIIALEHHEKYDGSGYPTGKSGEDIHIYARIVAIADVFDALNSQRVYKSSMDMEQVLKIMKEGKGTHFDPQLLDLFLKNIDQFLLIQNQFPDSN
ncbi:MAG: response regulator, partial [Sulfurimonas sp.]|nr:response regulator [Sulfurimonas sp.]